MNKLKIGLALSCGGWRGLSYIGVIKELERNGIKIGWIAGSSAGALIGGMYAALRDIEKIEAIFTNLRFRDLLMNFSDPFARDGLFKGVKMEAFLRRYLGKGEIRKLKIKYAAVVTDLFTGKPLIIDEGDLVSGIRASGSVPFILAPWEYKGRKVIDGAAVMPVPVKVVRKLGARKIVAVNPYTNVFKTMKRKREDRLSRIQVIKTAYYSMMGKMAEHDCETADVVIEPKIFEGRFGIFRKFVNHAAVVKDGVEATRLVLSKIKPLVTSQVG